MRGGEEMGGDVEELGNEKKIDVFMFADHCWSCVR